MALTDIPGCYKVSPSQIVTFSPDHGGCQRKWAFKYIAKIYPTEVSVSRQLGDDTHKLLEEYVKTRVHWEEGTKAAEVANAALPYLPPEGLLAYPEKGFLSEFQSNDKHRGRRILWNGKQDLVVPEWNGRLHLTDYKTTGNFQYAKTKEELMVDPQAVTYALVTMGEQRKEEIELRWLYLHTKEKNKVLPVITTMTMAHALEQFKSISPLAQDIERVHATVTNPLDLPPNPKACESFGGCPYKGNCKLSLAQRKVAIFGGNNLRKGPPKPMSDVLAAIRARQSGQATPTATETGRVQTAEPNPAPAPTSLDVADTKGTVVFKNWSAPDPINPPEKAQVGQPNPTLPTPAQVVESVAASVDAVIASVTPEKPAKRTRGPNKPKVTEIVSQSGVEVVDLPLTASDTPFTLFINCVPSWPVKDANLFIQEANRQVCELESTEEKPVYDYREIPFGNGAARLVKLTVELIKQAGVRELFIFTNTPEGSTLVSALTALAAGRTVRA